jgi:hypothetical protein
LNQKILLKEQSRVRNRSTMKSRDANRTSSLNMMKDLKEFWKISEGHQTQGFESHAPTKITEGKTVDFTNRNCGRKQGEKSESAASQYSWTNSTMIHKKKL